MNAYTEDAAVWKGLALAAPRGGVMQDWVIKTAYVVALVVSDILMLGAALRLAYWIRFELRIALEPTVVPSIEFYSQLALLMVAGCIVMFAFGGLYHWPNLGGGTTEYSRLFNVCSIAMLLVILAIFIFPAFVVARFWLVLSWLLALLMVGTARYLLRRVIYALRARGYLLVRAAIVGTNPEVLALARELRHHWTGYQVVGVFGIGWGVPPETGNADDLPPYLGTIKDLADVVRRMQIRELIVSASSLHREELLALYAQVHSVPGLELRLSTGLFELLTTGVVVRTAGIVPLIGLKKMRLSPFELLLKTTFEWTLACVGLVLLSPLLAVLALLIKLDSVGPVIHRRKVLGVGGREFDAYKLRTMYVDGERILRQHPELAARLHREGKLKDDPRITRVGRWLRRFSLDEIPQLFNVLAGQMSLVGPRMISPGEAEHYGNHRFNLLTVKPGITGLWQVSGRSDLSYRERVRLDMYYVRNYSIWKDFQILFIKTARVVFRAEGAY